MTFNLELVSFYWSARPTHSQGWSLFSHLVSVRPFPLFKISKKQNKFQVRIVIASGGTVGPAEGIIDDTHILYFEITSEF